MHRRYPRLLEGTGIERSVEIIWPYYLCLYIAFYRLCENGPDSPCWYRTWDEQVIKELHKEKNEEKTEKFAR